MPPNLRGTIDRRVLANYRAEPEEFDPLVPEPFSAREVGDTGMAIGSICLMRVEDARPRFAPSFAGLDVETVTHRISVEWEGNGEKGCGVYTPRRDLSSRFCALVGKRVLPGDVSCADFEAVEDDETGEYRLRVDCDTDFVRVEACETDEDALNGSVFGSVEEASGFFANARVRYSTSGTEHEAVELCPKEWEMTPLEIDELRSSFFERVEGARFDSAFCMKDIEHGWRARRPLAKP